MEEWQPELGSCGNQVGDWVCREHGRWMQTETWKTCRTIWPSNKHRKSHGMKTSGDEAVAEWKLTAWIGCCLMWWGRECRIERMAQRGLVSGWLHWANPTERAQQASCSAGSVVHGTESKQSPILQQVLARCHLFSAAKSADIKLGSGMVSFLANHTDLRTQGKQLQPCVSVVAYLMADSPRYMSASCWTPSCTEGKGLRDQEEQW